MKITKKVTSIVLALMLVISAFAGLSITAGAVDYPTSEITVNIHKYGIKQTADNVSTYIGWDTEGELTGTTTDATKVPRDAVALKGVTFTYYKVGDIYGKYLDDATVGGTPVTGSIDTDNPNSFEIPDDCTGTTTSTDTTGTAPFTVQPEDFGLYYVVETEKPDAVTTSSAPFFLYVPMTSSDGTDWLSEIHVYPKNLTTLGSASFTKTFGSNEVEEGKLGTDANATKIALYEQVGESINAETDTLIAEVTLTSDKVVHDIALTSQDDRYKGYNNDTNTAVKIQEAMGKIIVNNLPVGKYYFKETQSGTYDGASYGLNSKEQPFTIAAGDNTSISIDAEGVITGTADEKTTLNNTSTPTISKTVSGSIENVSISIDGTPVSVPTFRIGQEITYTLSSTVPTDIANYTKYTITDTLDTQLDLATNPAVTVTNGETVFEEGDYTVSTENDVITVTFNEAGIDKLTSDSNVDVQFKAVINSSAKINTAIENKAKITFNNGATGAGDGTDESEKVYVATVGYDFVKVDSADQSKALAGAEFELYDSDNRIYVTLTNPGSDTAAAVYTVTSTVNEVKITTPESGLVQIKGLQAKAYKLRETKAPAGYQLLTQDFSVTATLETSDNDTVKAAVAATSTGDATQGIVNVKQPDLPLTGGMGTILFTVAGLVLIGGAAFFFIRSRKSSKEEA